MDKHNPTVGEITAEAQRLLAETNAKGINAAEKGHIVANAKALLTLVDHLQPHVNAAQNAFGNQQPLVDQLNDLRNSLNKVIATYSAT